MRWKTQRREDEFKLINKGETFVFNHFAIFPIEIDGEMVWLEWYKEIWKCHNQLWAHAFPKLRKRRDMELPQYSAYNYFNITYEKKNKQ